MAAVVIVDSDPTWPRQFEELAAGLRQHLDGEVVSIDHIGSTAVPGLRAKDVIDIQVTVADLAQADRLAPAFERAGYRAAPYRHDHRPAGDPSDPGRWEKRLWQSQPGARPMSRQLRTEVAILRATGLGGRIPPADSFVVGSAVFSSDQPVAAASTDGDHQDQGERRDDGMEDAPAHAWLLSLAGLAR